LTLSLEEYLYKYISSLRRY